MTAIEFVKSKIDELVSRISYVNCRYEYDSISNTHLIEVIPNSVYKSDVDYQQAETSVIDEFINRFPYENVCFITDDSLVEIQNPIYEKQGITYDIFSTAIEKNWVALPWLNELSFPVPSSIHNVNILQPFAVSSYLNHFVFGAATQFTFPQTLLSQYSFPFYSVLPQYNYNLFFEEVVETKDDEDVSLNYSYALAA